MLKDTAAKFRTLLEVPAGRRVRVKNLEADGPTRARLFSLGFTPGAVVEVCPECSCQGARRVRVRGSSMVLGGSTANSIVCECCLTDVEALKDVCCSKEGAVMLTRCANVECDEPKRREGS